MGDRCMQLLRSEASEDHDDDREKHLKARKEWRLEPEALSSKPRRRWAAHWLPRKSAGCDPLTEVLRTQRVDVLDGNLLLALAAGTTRNC